MGLLCMSTDWLKCKSGRGVARACAMHPFTLWGLQRAQLECLVQVAAYAC